MGIRLTESRIPAGFVPEDLGEAYVVSDAAGEVKYALVSYLTSPIATGSTIDYVVFVLGENRTDATEFRYRWSCTTPSSGTADQTITDDGVFSVSVTQTGRLIVSLEVLRGSTIVAELRLSQWIGEAEPGLEALLSPTGMLEHLSIDSSLGSLGGNPRASRELINNFRSYIAVAIDPPDPDVGVDIPARFLAAIVYAQILRQPKEGFQGRDMEILGAAAELNDDWSLAGFFFSMDNALGVCQIRPQTLATIVERVPGVPYTPWTELPSDPDARHPVQQLILRNLNELPDADTVKVDLFNLLRFPKSNILMCARLLRQLASRPHRWPGSTGDQLNQDLNALQLIATEYHIGGTESPLPTIQDAPAPMDAKINSFGTRVVQREMKLPPIVLYFVDSASNGASAYAGNSLQRGDNDGEHRWGGSVTSTDQSGDSERYVRTLKQDLLDLGFKIVGDPNNGEFDARTEWAVREFQIYSRMPNIAAEVNPGIRYIQRLRQSRNRLPYTGPVTGVVNVATTVALQYWKGSGWRCPVVIEASKKNGSSFEPIPDKDNLWMPDDFTESSTTKYVRARDFSGYYDVPPGFAPNLNDPDDQIVIGRYYHDVWGGPTSLHHHAWKGQFGTEVTPLSLIGVSETALGQDTSEAGKARRSTYKVIRVVAEIENLAYFDSINCWDTAYLSMGICHWTIGRPGVTPFAGVDPDVERQGELAGFFAYLEQFEPDTFSRLLRRFGVGLDKTWRDEEGELTGKPLFKKTQRKYSGWLSLQQENGTFLTLDQQPYRTTANSQTEDKACGHYYFKSWHWFYRFQMAARTLLPFRTRMWDFARLRIRDILTVPWGVPSEVEHRVTDNGEFKDQRGRTRMVEIGDVYSSEQAVGLLLRWHINRPAQVVAYDATTGINKPAAKLLQAFAAAKSQAGADFERSPGEWGSEEEQALIKGIRDVAVNPDDLRNSMNFVEKFPPSDSSEQYGWPRDERGYQLNLEELAALDGETQALKRGRQSFRFFGDDLPKAPWNRAVDYFEWG